VLEWLLNINTLRCIVEGGDRATLRAKGQQILAGVLFLAMGTSVGSRAQSDSAQETQKPSEGAQPPAMGGVNTGGAHAAVLDAEHRPITAGGFVKSGPVVFEDIAEKSGLAKWHHTMGTPQKTVHHRDGGFRRWSAGLRQRWLAGYLPGERGSTYEAQAGKEPAPHAALFHNNHDGTFTDVTEKAGVTNERWGFGVAIADYDNDGWPDIFVSNFGKNRLYHNNHDGTFTDVAEKAGVALGNWSTGATWGDYDGDGKLDLFVPGYVHYDIANPPAQGSKSVAFSFCQFRGVKVMCGPRGTEGRAGPPLPQQRQWYLYGRKRDDGCVGLEVCLLRSGFAVRRCEQRRQGRSAGSGRFNAELPLREQRERSIRRCQLCLGLCAERGRPRDGVDGYRRRRSDA
jgi:hypothetical protein